MNNTIPTYLDGQLQPVDKLEAHLRGLRHQAVSVFVIHSGMVLIQRRALGKYHTPGLWANTCCTHPHWKEDPLDCAVRRLSEELGITGVMPTWRGQVEYRAEVGNGMIEHEVVDLFVALPKHKPDLRPDPVEVMDTDWVNADELRQRMSDQPEIFTPWFRIYMQNHAAKLLPEL